MVVKSDSFELYILDSIEEVRRMIQVCEGGHKQQIAYSSYHDSLTQICFDCRTIRTNCKEFAKKEIEE